MDDSYTLRFYFTGTIDKLTYKLGPEQLMAEDQKNWSKSPSTSPGSSLRPDQKAARRRLIIAGIVGNALEWYDFAIYGYFAAIIGKHFFPARDVVGATINAYGAFAAGFLMRPIGGLLFGHIGDRASRRLALMLSVLAMAIPTFLIGLLPDYAQIGIAATILMVVLRMIQGLSVGWRIHDISGIAGGMGGAAMTWLYGKLERLRRGRGNSTGFGSRHFN